MPTGIAARCDDNDVNAVAMEHLRSARALGRVVFVLWAVLVGSARASAEPSTSKPPAYDFSPERPCPYCGITPEYPAGRVGLHWHSHWNTVGVREYIVTPLAAAIALGIPTLISPAREARWDSPILFDSGARNLLLVESPGARQAAADVSDVLYVIAYSQPVFDTLVVAWWLRDSPQATTATSAGLICAHHTQLSLYGNPYLDTGTCLVAVLNTAVTGALRIASNNHWASDVIVGHIMGYLLGYLMPTLLYYKQFSFTPHEDDGPPAPSQPLFTLLPLIGASSAQLALVGLF